MEKANAGPAGMEKHTDTTGMDLLESRRGGLCQKLVTEGLLRRFPGGCSARHDYRRGSCGQCAGVAVIRPMLALDRPIEIARLLGLLLLR